MLKIIALFVTLGLGVWTSWKDFKSENGTAVSRTVIFYGILFAILLVITFAVDDLKETEQNKIDLERYSSLIDSTESLFDSTNTNIRNQYSILARLNLALQNQNDALKFQISQNQKLIDNQYYRSSVLQNRIKNRTDATLKMIDSISFDLLELGRKQQFSMLQLNNLDISQRNGMSQLLKANDILNRLEMPISSFKIKLTLRISLADSIDQPRGRNLFFLDYKGSQVDLVQSLEKRKGGYKHFLSPLALDGIELRNFNEIKEYFTRKFSILNLEFFKDTASEFFNNKIVSNNKHKIQFKYSSERLMPYYLVGDPLSYYQDIIITIDSISLNPLKLKSMYDIFKECYISVELFHFNYKKYPLVFKLYDLLLKKSFEKQMNIKSFTLEPHMTILYGKDYSMKAFFNEQKNFKIPYSLSNRDNIWFDSQLDIQTASFLVFVPEL